MDRKNNASQRHTTAPSGQALRVKTFGAAQVEPRAGKRSRLRPARLRCGAPTMDGGRGRQPSRAAFVTQAGALLRKNLRYQRKNW